MTAPDDTVDLLRRAREQVQTGLDAMRASMIAYPLYWPDGDYARGLENGLGGATGTFAGMFTPDVAEAIVEQLDHWISRGELFPDHLHSVNADPVIAIAAALLREEAPQ